MMCENCKQHQAIIHLTEIVNGTNKQAHLCEHCAKEQGLINQRRRAEALAKRATHAKRDPYPNVIATDEYSFLRYLIGLPKNGAALDSIRKEEVVLWDMERKQARPELENAVTPFCRLLVAACGPFAGHVAEAIQTVTGRLARKHTGRRSVRPPRSTYSSRLFLRRLQAVTDRSSLYAEIAGRRSRNLAKFSKLVRPEWRKLRRTFPPLVDWMEDTAEIRRGSKRQVLRHLYDYLPIVFLPGEGNYGQRQ